MIKRAVWFGSGFTAGLAGSYWVKRAVRQRVERYAPEHLRHQAADRARDLRHDVLTAVNEGREAMRRHAEEMRADLEAQQRRRSLRAVSSG